MRALHVTDSARLMSRSAEEAALSRFGAPESDDAEGMWREACCERMRQAYLQAVVRAGRVPHWRKRETWRA